MERKQQLLNQKRQPQDQQLINLQPHTILNFSPKQMEVATQLVSLHCLPAAESDTGDCVAISGKTPKDAVLEAMKKQFYNVYG